MSYKSFFKYSCAAAFLALSTANGSASEQTTQIDAAEHSKPFSQAPIAITGTQIRGSLDGQKIQKIVSFSPNQKTINDYSLSVTINSNKTEVMELTGRRSGSNEPVFAAKVSSKGHFVFHLYQPIAPIADADDAGTQHKSVLQFTKIAFEAIIQVTPMDRQDAGFRKLSLLVVLPSGPASNPDVIVQEEGLSEDLEKLYVAFTSGKSVHIGERGVEASGKSSGQGDRQERFKKRQGYEDLLSEQDKAAQDKGLDPDTRNMPQYIPSPHA